VVPSIFLLPMVKKIGFSLVRESRILVPDEMKILRPGGRAVRAGSLCGAPGTGSGHGPARL